MSKIIGIDLGSTLSEVSVVENGQPTIIVNDEGSRTTPSVIYFDKEGARKVGASAKRQAVTNPKNTIVLVKRFMGCTYDEVKSYVDRFQYEVRNINGFPRIVVDGREYSPEELSATILQKMKKTAEDYLGTEVKEAVITCPAFYNDAQRQSVYNAGKIAGLDVKRVIAEPTAAILASGIDLKKDGKYMVVDYGGSTLDFSIADISDGVVEILASHGDVFAGGSDLDKLLADEIVKQFKEDTGLDAYTDPMAMSRILEAAEKAKIELTSSNSTDVSLPYLMPKDNTPMHLNVSITRAKFEQLISKEVTKVMECGKQALVKANMKATDLNGLILVGGSTRIPYVQDQLEKTFGIKLIKSASPDEAVALGAAVQGSILSGEKDDVLLLDVTPISYAIETLGGVATKLVEQGTTIPTTKSQVFTTAQDNQPSVTIRVVQGERPMANDNKTIGVFNLDGIIPARKGIPQIEVKFDINASGILNVSAKDLGTGKEQHITIENSTLSESEIERMKKEAADNAEADKKRLEEVQKLNNADAYAFNIEKAMSEFGDKVTDEEKNKVTTLIEQLKKAVTEKDYSECDRLQKEISVIWEPIVSKIYQNNSGGQGGQSMNPNDFMNMFRNAQNMYGGAGQGGNTQTAQPETEDVQEAQEI